MPSVVQGAPYALWFPPNHKIIYLVYNTLSHNKNVTALQYARYRGAGKPVIHVDRCMYYGLFLDDFYTFRICLDNFNINIYESVV